MATWKKQSLGLGFSLLLSAAATAQTATLSIEAAAINGNPVANGSMGRIVASPGDIVEVKFWIRDWSPNGEILRSYQVTLDPASFTSGPAGQIAPVGYDQRGRTNNEENAFIDDSDPDFIHKGENIIPLVHALGTEYKWISVVFDSNKGPISKQDGTKKSCGTILLLVSDDARGEFAISAFKDRELTLFNDPKNNQVTPLDMEPLIITVPDAGTWARIGLSVPPSGAIDARTSPNSSESAWTTITLISSGDASSLSPSDFIIDDQTSNPPVIKDMEVRDSRVILHLDRGIRAGRWTVVTHTPSGSTTRIGHLPGDVNNDRKSDANDVVRLIESLNGTGELPLYQSDIDADGSLTTKDLAGLIRLLANPNARPTRIQD